MMYIGTAGWSLRTELQELFPARGTHLQRYSAQLNAVEINSSFYKDHQPKTYARWAEETPADFRFAVKIPKRFTHELGLKVHRDELRAFIAGPAELGRKLRVLLVQLPPRLEFSAPVARAFFETFRDIHTGPLVLEPRHPSWARADVFGMLRDFEVHPVIADPGLNLLPFAWGNLCYHRLHGSPDIYKSDYPPEYLQALGSELNGLPEAWCIFDNTTYGCATLNALELRGPVAELATAQAMKQKMRNAFLGTARVDSHA